MNNIEIIATGKYLPNKKVISSELADILNVTEDFVVSRTGIKTRYYAENESIEIMAINAVKDLLNKSNINKNEIELIIVATTSTSSLMPGISFKIQKEFKIENCICLDILAGCAGFINAFDIANLYVSSCKCNNALIIGVDKLSTYIDKNDISTAVVLSDGAGAVYIKKTDENKFYNSNICCDGLRGDILTCKINESIYMNGKEIYKYAVCETINNINELLKNSNENIDNIKYIIPHQANLRIIESIAKKLNVSNEKFFVDIDSVGNTFCASIPIALDDMYSKNLLRVNDKIILLGFGGGLNTGSILMEV